jgi:type IV pilus assembly protein PilQ
MRWFVSVWLLFLAVMAWGSPFDDPRHLFAKRACQQSAYQLRYASVDGVKKALVKSGLLVKPGWLYWDKRLNTLVYCVLPDKQRGVHQLLQALDKPVRQVKVGVKIVSVDEDWLESLGVQWDFQGMREEASHSFLLLQSKLGLKILSQISAKKQKERALVVASPTLVTSNNQPAFIESGDKIPYQERNHDGDLSTVFKDALLHLSITPSVLAEGKLHLKINLHYDKVSAFSVAGMPVIRAQQLQTDIVTHSGQLLVLGGIIENRLENQHERVPFLSRIPLIGRAFRYHKQSSGRKQLLVFLYPEIIK